MSASVPRTAGSDPRFLRRMLIGSMYVQFTGMVLLHTATYLIPEMHAVAGLSLASAGLVAAAPMLGMFVTLPVWGALVDKFGERRSVLWGLSISGSAALAATQTDSIGTFAAFQVLCGCGAGSASTASGRFVVGWYPQHRRGTAMGIRQVSQPAAFAFAAVTTPVLARAVGFSTAMILPAIAAALALLTVLLVLVDPPGDELSDGEPAAVLNPYRRSNALVRVHVASALLTLPQLALFSFALVWLMDRHDMPVLAASVLVGGAQLLGGAGRILVGMWSDRTGSRLRPMMLMAWLVLGVTAAFIVTESTVIGIPLMMIASAVAIAANSIAMTIVAEMAGSAWSGRAMSIQLSGQVFISALVPPTYGFLIGEFGYTWAYLLLLPATLAAIWMIPRTLR